MVILRAKFHVVSSLLSVFKNSDFDAISKVPIALPLKLRLTRKLKYGSHPGKPYLEESFQGNWFVSKLWVAALTVLLLCWLLSLPDKPLGRILTSTSRMLKPSRRPSGATVSQPCNSTIVYRCQSVLLSVLILSSLFPGLPSDTNVVTPNTECSWDFTTKTRSTNDDGTSLDLEWEDEEGEG